MCVYIYIHINLIFGTTLTISKVASAFCESNTLVGKILAMVAENRDVKGILHEVLGVDGCHLSVRSAMTYCRRNEVVSFFTLSKRALAAAGDIIIGYQVLIHTS